MKYNDYLKRVSKRFETQFDEIDPQWNFDQGHEFEVTLAILLDDLLPDKYGVCRGFVTPQDGTPKGDDIIIYDRLSAPLLRPSSEFKFTRKENVPLEATYAYIEAKNTIELSTKSKGTYILNAVEQSRKVRSLQRKIRCQDELLEDTCFSSDCYQIKKHGGQPNFHNPMYTVVFARGARIKGELEKDPEIIRAALKDIDLGEGAPDLLVIGNDIVIAPVFSPQDKEINYEGPFSVDGLHDLSIFIMPGLAYGFGLASIQYALQKIKLKNVPLLNILGEAIDIGNQNINKT